MSLPQIIPILKEAGFEKISDPLFHQTLGRAIILKKACGEQGVDFNLLKQKIEMGLKQS